MIRLLLTKARALAFALFLTGATCTVGLAQDDAPTYTPAQIEKLIRHARTGSAHIRPQAAARLVRAGKPAADRLLAEAGESNADLAALGTSLVEVFGLFEDDRLRGRLWPALEDSEFPWRPAASRSLAGAPTPAERERFESFLDDPIAPVRVACLSALAYLTDTNDDAQEARFLAQAVLLLADENDAVRRGAALILDRRGHGRAMLWLLEDLKRDDVFFDQATGEAARYASRDVLLDREIDLGEYNPERPQDNETALAALEQRLLARAREMESQLPEARRNVVPRTVPAIALAGARIDGALVGLQLRSCRRGDYYLRWTRDDVLVIGYGNPLRIQLAEGTTKRLVEISNRAQVATNGKLFWGRPGCDVESFRMPNISDPGGRPQQLILLKNEQPAQDLRPPALTELGAAMASSIPADADLDQSDPRTRTLARRVRGAFASIGGPLPTVEDDAGR